MYIKKHKLGYVNFLGRPIQQSYKHTQPIFGSISIPQRQFTSIWNTSMNKPVARFWGDSDRDGIINGLDCAPNNKRLQGPIHTQQKTEMIVIRATKSDKKMLKEKKISPTKLFNEALEKHIKKKYKGKAKR